MFTPLGETPIVITSAPSSEKTCGAIRYAAPLAQSTTMRNPSRERCAGKVLFRYTMYRPVASSIRCAFPICGDGGRFSLRCSPYISPSIRDSTSSGSLKPSRPKNLIPLSWYGLWEAEMTTPASARIEWVRNAIPGVGIGPTSRTSPPIAQIPAASAVSNM